MTESTTVAAEKRVETAELALGEETVVPDATGTGRAEAVKALLIAVEKAVPVVTALVTLADDRADLTVYFTLTLLAS
jgi:hypothetical protein